MQKTSQGSVEPEKEHCWQIWNSIFWQIRPSCSVRNTLCLVQFGGRPYKSDRCGHNSEWKFFLTSSPGTLTYGVIDLGVFLPLVIHLPSEKLILPNFSMLRGVAVSVCFPEVRNRKQTESGLPSAKVLKSGKAVFLQIRLKLDLFWKYELRFLLAIQGFEAPQSPFYTSIDTV